MNEENRPMTISQHLNMAGENIKYRDYEAAVNRCRKVLERMAKTILREKGFWDETCHDDRNGRYSDKPNYNRMLTVLRKHKVLDYQTMTRVFEIGRIVGNQGSHDNEDGSVSEVDAKFIYNNTKKYAETVFLKDHPEAEPDVVVSIGNIENDGRITGQKDQYQDRLQQTNKSDEEREKDEQARKREEEERKRKDEEEKRKSAPEAAMENAWRAHNYKRWESAEHLFAQVLETEGIDNEPSIQKAAAFMLMCYQGETERSAAAREELKTICSDSPWICLALACTAEEKEAKEWAEYGMQVPGPSVPRQYCANIKSMIDHGEKERETEQQREAEQKRWEEERQRAAAEEEERKAEQARIAQENERLAMEREAIIQRKISSGFKEHVLRLIPIALGILLFSVLSGRRIVAIFAIAVFVVLALDALIEANNDVTENASTAALLKRYKTGKMTASYAFCAATSLLACLLV